MRTHPLWIIWSGATLLLWAVWIALVYLPLRQNGHHEETLRAEWMQSENELTSRIRTAPEVMKRIEDLETALDSVTAGLPKSGHVKEYLDVLTELGRASGVRSIEASPELVSMMALRKFAQGPRVTLDTLVVELTASGDFRKIGGWLDQVEAQASFRHWRLGRWDRGEEPGTVRFSGAAAFLVAVPKGESS